MIGTLVAGVIFLIASRHVFAMQGLATDNLVKTLDRQIEVLEKDRDSYRASLHDERDAHQALQLRLKEIENRPNLASINGLLAAHIASVEKISATLESHIEADAKMFQGLSDALERIPDTLERMSAAFDRRQSIVLDTLAKPH